MRKFLLSVSALVFMLIATPQSTLAFCSDGAPQVYLEAAQYLFEDEVLKGYPDGSCKLQNSINRAENVTFLLRNAYGGDDVPDVKYTKGWNDVPLAQLKNEWYGAFIAKASELGIIKGGSDGRLRPGDQVIGSEMLVMTIRTEFGQMPVGDNQQWFDPYYDVAKEVGMYTIEPGAKATRGDVVRTIFDMNKNFDALGGAIASYIPSQQPNSNTHSSQPTVTAAPTTSSHSGPISWRQLIENVDQLSAQQVATKLRNLDETERLQLSIYSAYANLLHVIACEADPSIVMTYNSYSQENCASVIQQWIQTLQFSGGNTSQAISYALEQRNTMLIGLKCSSGEIDAASCSSYTGAVQNLNNMNHETSMRIISNMSPNGCLIGDPGCVAY